MRCRIADLWDGPSTAWRVIPTNLTRRADGSAVMGAGLARQAATRFPALPARLGQALAAGQDRLVVFPDWRLVAAPTKRHWRDPSPPDLVEATLAALARFARQVAPDPVRVPLLGAGLGGLDPARVLAWMAAAFAACPTVLVCLPPDFRPADWRQGLHLW